MPPVSEKYNTQTDNKSKRSGKMVHWLRRVCAAAAVLALVVLATVSVDAFGYDLWGRIATWTDDFFHFQDETQGPEVSVPDVRDEKQYSSLQEALDEYMITRKLAPNWLPDGYTLADISAYDTPRELAIYANYKNGETELFVSIRQLLGGIPEDVEKSEDFIEAYEANGVTYFLFKNFDDMKAAWTIDEFECYISGKLTIEEMKAIIDSI